MVFDRNTKSLRSYLNAKVTGDVTAAQDSILSAHPAWVGSLGNPFRGSLDEVRVYHTALTPAWIEAEYLGTDLYQLGPVEMAP